MTSNLTVKPQPSFLVFGAHFSARLDIIDISEAAMWTSTGSACFGVRNKDRPSRDDLRRASSDDLAKKLNIGNPTIVMHRRKAERRLLASIVGKP